MDRVEDCASYLLGKPHRQIMAALRRRLTPLGVTPVQFGVLQVLWEDGGTGLSAAAVGERLAIDSATLTGIVDRLERADLVVRDRAPRDRRVTLLRLTAAGLAVRAEGAPEIDAANRDFFARFTPDDATTLRRLLRTAAHDD